MKNFNKLKINSCKTKRPEKLMGISSSIRHNRNDNKETPKNRLEPRGSC